MKANAPTTHGTIPLFKTLKNTYPGLKTLLFDMDGTIFNSEGYHAQALLNIGENHKIVPPHPLEEVHALLVGKADHFVFETIRQWENFPQHWSVTDFVREKNNNLLVILKSVDPRDFFPQEILALMLEAKNEKLKLGLITSSEKIVTLELLTMAGIFEHFDVVLTRDDCPAHKPDPWPYKEAMKRLDVRPEEALIFEDSDVGLTAALASGAQVIKVKWFTA